MAEGAGNVMRGMADTLSASMQGASPIVQSLDGTPQQKRLGNLIEMDYGPSIEGVNDPRGGPMKVDPTKHVVLRDPGTGTLGVYERGPNTTQDTIAAIGRLLSFGMTAPATAPIARAPNTAAAAVRDFDASNIDPALASTSAGRTAPLAAQTIRNAPFVGDFAVGGGVAQRLGQAETQAGRVAGMYGEAADPAQAGRVLQAGVGKFREKGGDFAKKSNELFGSVEKAVDDKLLFVNADRSVAALNEINNKFGGSKTLSEVTSKPVLGKIERGLNEGGLTYSELKELRTWVGTQLDSRSKLFPEVAEQDWRKLYGSLTDDMRAAAVAAGPETAKAFDRANRFYSAGATRASEKLQSILDADSPEKAFNQIMLAARAKPGSADSQKVWAAMRSMPAEEWREVSAAVIAEIGKGRDGFSVTQFANNYKALSEPAKTALFSGKGMGESREALEALVRSAERLSRMEQYQNRSQSMSQGITAASGAAMFADPLTTTLSGIGAAATGRLLMSPAVARWMARASEAKRPEAMTARVAELETLIQTQRGISSELSALRDGLRDLLRSGPRPMAAPARDEEADK